MEMNEIGGSKVHSYDADGGAQTGSRSVRRLLQRQAPGYYRYRVGQIVVTVVTDGERNAPLDDKFVLNATREEVASALRSSFLPSDRLITFFNPVVLHTESKLVLIDTGFGQGAFDQTQGAVGQLELNLIAAGIPPEAIDIVAISHCHPDHVNGLLKADGKPTFPNARVLVPAEEWKFWTDSQEKAKAPAGRMQMLFQNNLRIFGALGSAITTYAWNEEIARGVTSVPTPGHSIGHTSFLVASGGEQMFIQGDVAHNPALFVPNPGWHAAIDQDAETAEHTRRRVYDMLVADRLRVQGFHFPFPGVGHIEKAPTGYRFVPAPWKTSL
jgi:glyoxylase-like metal-dependent hydrolase (beta-lactamase superfamily II)